MATGSPTLANETVCKLSQNDTNDNNDGNELKLQSSSEINSSSKTISSMQLSNGSSVLTAGPPFNMISINNVNNDDATQSTINSETTNSSDLIPDATKSMANATGEVLIASSSNNGTDKVTGSQTNDSSRIPSPTADVVVSTTSPSLQNSAVSSQQTAVHRSISDSNVLSPNSRLPKIESESNIPIMPSEIVPHNSTSEVTSSHLSSEPCDEINETKTTENQSEQVKCENTQGNEDDNSPEEDKTNSLVEEIESNSDFSAVCDFFIQFGEKLGISYSIADLKEMLEEKEFVHEELIELHIKLLRKRRKWINRDKWERSLVKFIADYSQVDAWELEKFGYPAVRYSVKLKILKVLLECQFDFNNKFKSLVNAQESSSLRILPIGRDIKGNMYWYQLDEMANIRVYREFIDDETTWTPVCKDKSELIALIEKLKSETQLQPLKENSSTKTSSCESEVEEEEEEEEEDEKQEEDKDEEEIELKEEEESEQEKQEKGENGDCATSNENQQKTVPMETSDDTLVTVKIEASSDKSISSQPQILNGRESIEDLTSKKLTAFSSSSPSSSLPPPPPLIKVYSGSFSRKHVKIEPHVTSIEACRGASVSSVNECDDVNNCMSDLLDQVVKTENLESTSNQAIAPTSLPPPPLVLLPMSEGRKSHRSLRSNSSYVTCSLEQVTPVKVSRVKVEKVQHEETIESIVQSVCDHLVDQVLELLEEKESMNSANGKTSTARGRGRGRGARGRRRKSRGASTSVSSANRSPATGKSNSSSRQRPMLSRELMDLNGLAEIELTAFHDDTSNSMSHNDATDSAPRVRQSRRIAQLQEKKTAELAEKLKREQERAEADAVKRAELLKQREAKRIAFQMSLQSGRKGARFKDSSSEYDEKASSSDESFSSDNGRSRKKKGAKGKRKKGTKKNPYPWLHDDDSSEEPEEEEDEEEEEEIEDEVLKFDDNNEDEFACEEFEECAEPVVLRRARTAKKIVSESGSDDESSCEAHEEKSLVDDTVCRRCTKGTSPEWILLCDKCDAGFHTSCLIPSLMIIPDGDWFCPPCENEMLISKLTERLAEIEVLIEEQEKLAAKIAADKEREEAKTARLRFVTVNEENIIPSDDEENGARTHTRKKSKKEYNESDFEDDEMNATGNCYGETNGQVDENGESISIKAPAKKRVRRKPERKHRVDESSESDSGSQSQESSESRSESDSQSDEFPLRSARRCKKISYQFKEYDELIKSACRASGDEYEEEPAVKNDTYEEGNEEEEDDDDDEEDDSPNSTGMPHSLGKDMATIEAAFAAEQKELSTKGLSIANDSTIIVANVTVDGDTTGPSDATAPESQAHSQDTSSNKVKSADAEDDSDDGDDTVPKPKRGAPGIPCTKKKPLKKRRALNDLDSPTDDDTSDESFKGSSDTEVEELSEAVTEEDSEATEDESDDSDFREYRKASRRSAAGRGNKKGRKDKSSKSRSRRRDDDFVDDSDDDDEYLGSRKTRGAAKKRKSYREVSSDETEEDEEWVSDASDKPKSKKVKKSKNSDDSQSSDEEWGKRKSKSKRKKSWGASDDEDAEENEKTSEDDDDDAAEDDTENSESPEEESDGESDSSDSSVAKKKKRKPPPPKKKAKGKVKGKGKGKGKKSTAKSPGKAKVRQTAATSRAAAAAASVTPASGGPDETDPAADTTGEAAKPVAPKIVKEKPVRELRGSHARNAKARIISLKEDDDDEDDEEIEEKPVKASRGKRKLKTDAVEEAKESETSSVQGANKTEAKTQDLVQTPAPVMSHLAAALSQPVIPTSDAPAQPTSEIPTRPSVESPMIVAALAGRSQISSPHILPPGQSGPLPPHVVGPPGQPLPPHPPPGHFPPGHPANPHPHPHSLPPHQMYPGHPHAYPPPGHPGHLPPHHLMPGHPLSLQGPPGHPGHPGHLAHPGHPGHPGHPPHPGHPAHIRHPRLPGPIPAHVRPGPPPSGSHPPTTAPPPGPPPPPVSRASTADGSSPLNALAAFASRDPGNNTTAGSPVPPSTQATHGPPGPFNSYPLHGAPLPPGTTAHPVSRSSSTPTPPTSSSSGPSASRAEGEYTITSLDSYPRSKQSKSASQAATAASKARSESPSDPSYPPSSSPHRILNLDGPPPHYSGPHSTRPGGPGPYGHPGHPAHPAYDPKRMMHPGAMLPPGYPHGSHGPSPYGPPVGPHVVPPGAPGHPSGPPGPPPPGFPPNARGYFPPGAHPPPPPPHGYPPQGPPHPIDPYLLFPWWNNPNRMA